MTARMFGLLLAMAAAPTAGGQGVPWAPHEPPCVLNTGHYLIKGGVLHLKTGVETRFADQRNRRLNEARTVLERAITEERQGQNPAAWYYLGRAYAVVEDLAGADSAFRRARALAPDCAEDIARHAVRLSQIALNRGRQAWQADQQDSALTWFRLAGALDTTNVNVPLIISQHFPDTPEADSAMGRLQLSRQALPAEALSPGARPAALEVAKTFEARAYREAPAAQTVARTRAVRDSTARLVANDSTQLAGILEQVRPVRARLSARSLAAFRRDSTRVAERLAGNRTALDSLRRAVAADSQVAASALTPAVEQFAGFLRRYPDDPEAAQAWIRLLTAAGHQASLDSALGWLIDSAQIGGTVAVRIAAGLHRDWLNPHARRLLDHALTRNPNDHGALSVLTGVHYVTGRPAELLRVAHRRLSLAPLDPDAARAVAIGWDLSLNRDSALKYLALSDSGLGWNVRTGALLLGQRATALDGHVVNAGSTPRPALDLIFEFLLANGQPLGAVTVTVPPLAPGARAPFAARLEQGGAVSWRYRPK